MKIKIRSKYQYINKDEADIIKEVFEYTKKLELKKAKKLLSTISIEDIIERFIDEDNLNDVLTDKTLKIYKKIIIICKEFHSNTMTLVSDEIYDPMLNRYKLYRDEPIIENLKLSRRNVDTKHNYPELKGTLDKANVFHISDKKVKLDRSLEEFICKIFNTCDNKYYHFIVTKKFDGASIVADVKDDKLVLALTRGEDDKGADLTHLFKHIKFKRHKGRAGVKFECIMTKENFIKYCDDKKRKYASLRSAVVSILTRTSDTEYSKYLSLAPIQATDIDIHKDVNYEILNNNYATDVKNECWYIETNNIEECLDRLDYIINDCKDEREDLDYAIDGIVIDCIDSNVREKLGRRNDINQYQIAFKFEAEEVWTTVTHVETTVGRTGLITPVVYYEPVMFNGGKHDHSTISSFNRFKKLDLHYGDRIKVTYNNDVMPYVSKPDIPNLFDDEDDKELIKFPDTCISCGGELQLVQANYYCYNNECPAKRITFYTHFYKKLGIANISDKTVEKMIECGAINGLDSLLEIDYKKLINVEGFGELKIKDYREQIDTLKEREIDEAKLASALSVSGETIARTILTYIDLKSILKDAGKLIQLEIPQAGDKTKTSFIVNLRFVKDCVVKYMKMLKVVPVKNGSSKIKVYFTGFRDKELVEMLEPLGIKVASGFNKSLDYLIVKDSDTSGPKVDKAKECGMQIMTKQEFAKFIREEFI